MAAAVDRLVEMQQKDVSILKEMYTSKNKSRTSIGYEAIDNYIRWIEQDENESNYIKFFCLNADFSDGTFVVIVSRRVLIMFYLTTFVYEWIDHEQRKKIEQKKNIQRTTIKLIISSILKNSIYLGSQLVHNVCFIEDLF